MIRHITASIFNLAAIAICGVVGVFFGGLVDVADTHLLDAVLPVLSLALLVSTLVWAVRDAHPIRGRR